MKNLSEKILLLSFILTVFCVCQAKAVTTNYRQETDSRRIAFTINDNWKFSPNDSENAAKSELPENVWKTVNIPHTWNAEDVFDDTPDYRRGGSWYRKDLALNSRFKEKRIFLYFEGANQVADVFVKERFVGRHIGGYT